MGTKAPSRSGKTDGAGRAPIDPELADLWADFKKSADPVLRDRLILHYAPLVKFVAGRVSVGLPNTVEEQDLVSYGIFGLIDAISKFEPDRGFKFETYAVNRIRGAIIDELRSIDWVPRSLRAKAREVEKTMTRLENKLRRSPTEDEVAVAMSMSVGDLREFFGQISFGSLAALDELLTLGDDGSGQVSLVDTLEDASAEDPEEAFESQEMKTILSKVIDRLPEREQRVITLYYYEGLTLLQIGQILGVTESRVSQMHSKAVLQLRARLAEVTA